MISFSATLTTGAVAGSQYGKGPYGQGLYSQYTPQTQNFAGSLTPSIALSGALVATESFAGDLPPHVALAGGLSRIAVVTGDLPPHVAFSAGLTVTPAVELAGNLAPAITFGPSQLTTPQAIYGDLAPAVTFAANMGVIYAITGDLAPQMALGASLTGVWDLAGNMTVSVGLAASGQFGPLWAASEPCSPPAWEESGSCPPSLWTPSIPPSWAVIGVNDPAGYGMRAYSAGDYEEFVSPWESAELCNGG